jgi:UDP-glucose 4-epimerase
LSILGDGQQTKSYIHVEDVLRAVFHASPGQEAPFAAYNVATGDYVSVTEIAHLAIEVVGLDVAEVSLEYSGGARGWKGDVPIVRLDTTRIKATGWECHRNTREALQASMIAMLADRDRLGWE